ncbi:hypothetical protein CsSME_00051916 [Camellia sinensis var. sinensis]
MVYVQVKEAGTSVICQDAKTRKRVGGSDTS